MIVWRAMPCLCRLPGKILQTNRGISVSLVDIPPANGAPQRGLRNKDIEIFLQYMRLADVFDAVVDFSGGPPLGFEDDDPD